MDQMDKGFNATRSTAPKWTMRAKPDFVVGGQVPSWVNSIPGPKYNCNADVFKTKQPVYTMRMKPEVVVGALSPKWQRQIPGPKYSYNADVVKPRQPVYTISGGRSEKTNKDAGDDQPPPRSPVLDGAYAQTKKADPSFSFGAKRDFVSGGAVPSWVNSIPGPKYNYSVDTFKKKQPTYTIGKKLPSESDLMAVRSPGPVYSGSAIDAKKQAEVDSTKKKSFAPGFGVGSRWGGPANDMVRSGALSRYDSPCIRR